MARTASVADPPSGAGRTKRTPWQCLPYPALAAWLIAEHSYCEQRVHLWLKEPGERVSVPRQLEGTEAARSQEAAASFGRNIHELFAEKAVEISAEELSIIEASGQQYYLLESTLSGEFDNLPILGRPDVVVMKDRRATLVVDYKVTGSTQLSMGHRVQLYVYGYLLAQNDYNVKDLILAAVLIPRAAANSIATSSPMVAQAVVEKVAASRSRAPQANNWTAKKWKLVGTPVILRAFPYEPERARRELTFVAGYWHGGRNPIPTGKPAKCACCLYNKLKLCSKAAGGFLGL